MNVGDSVVFINSTDERKKILS